MAEVNLAARYERFCRVPSDIYLHLPRLVELVNETEARHVIELGTRTGVSTVAWLYALENRGRLTSVDLGSKPDIGDWDHWTFIQGDDMDPAIRNSLEPAEIVFIDTSHFYEHTLAELESYAPLATKRIVLHDTQLRRPDGSPSRPIFPVRTAVKEFTAKYGLDWYEHTDCWGLGVINMEAERG